MLNLFLDYLWGIETQVHQFGVDKVLEFLDYLWGIETGNYWRRVTEKADVFRLPMRDWNALNGDSGACGRKVFRLPMRDWNRALPGFASRSTRFLDYLWGIETCMSNGSKKAGKSFLDYLWGIETR